MLVERVKIADEERVFCLALTNGIQQFTDVELVQEDARYLKRIRYGL